MGTARRPGAHSHRGLQPVAAAWYRLFTESHPGYGFVDEQTPELTIAVVPSRRGRGYGAELLTSLLAQAAEDGFPAISLSVEPDNPALALYERHGFEKVGERGGALVMRAQLGGGGGGDWGRGGGAAGRELLKLDEAAVGIREVRRAAPVVVLRFRSEPRRLAIHVSDSNREVVYVRWHALLRLSPYVDEQRHPVDVERRPARPRRRRLTPEDAPVEVDERLHMIGEQPDFGNHGRQQPSR